AKIVLLPAFVGYLIILFNAKNLSAYSKNMAKLAPPLIILSVISAISFFVSLTGGTLGELEILISILSIGIGLWMLYLMIYGLNDIALFFQIPDEGKRFTDLFPFLAGFQIAMFVFLLILPGLSLILLFAELAVHVVFLVRLAQFSQFNFVFPTPSEAPVSY
ncbi:MAG: hypothetical protein WBL80_09080, partial [Erysipelotrichaceae bacterium]